MAHHGSTSPPRRVLAVDDDPVSTLIIENALADQFLVDTAHSGEEALERIERVMPDIILLDVIMGGMDGFAVCSALRAQPWGRTLPVVMLTSQDDTASIAEAFRVGTTDFIGKPINAALLPYRVKCLLRAWDTLQALGLRERQLAAAQRIAELGHWEIKPAQGRFQLSESARELLKLPDPPQRQAADPALVASPKLSSEPSIEQVLAAVLDQVLEEERESVQRVFSGFFTQGGKPTRFEHRLRDGRVLRQCAEYSRETGGWLGTVQDVTAMHRSAQRIVKLAYYDQATGLPNRDFLIEFLQCRLAEDQSAEISILAVEIEALKRVGRGWGQAVTKPLARDLAERLSAATGFPRPQPPFKSPLDWTADQSGLLACVSDSAFAILTEADAAQTLALGQRLLADLAQPIEVAGIKLSIRAALGIAHRSTPQTEAEDLLRHALSAAAACPAPDRVQRYQHQFDTEERDRLSLEARLRRAIDRDELELWYQPKVDSNRNTLVAAEGLVRWRDPHEGLIPPGRFIPLAEETGLIVPLTDRVLDIACKDLRRMRAPGLTPVEISVNISAAQLDDRRLPQEIAARLSKAGLPPSCLELEITEQALMSRVDSVIDTLTELHALGISLSLDDFGTGYSSLGYLGRFPLDTLKIDRSFVTALGTGAAGESVVHAIVALAQGLKLKVIAEGIETQAQADWLRRNGCSLHQGFFYSRPLEFDAFLRLLDTRSSPPWRPSTCVPQAVC